jgi:heat shock protein beta
LDDPLDEYVFSHLNEYEKKKLMNVGKGEFKFPDDDDSSRRTQKKLKKMFTPLIDWWKMLLSDQIENVVVS